MLPVSNGSKSGSPPTFLTATAFPLETLMYGYDCDSYYLSGLTNLTPMSTKLGGPKAVGLSIGFIGVYGGP